MNFCGNNSCCGLKELTGLTAEDLRLTPEKFKEKMKEHFLSYCTTLWSDSDYFFQIIYTNLDTLVNSAFLEQVGFKLASSFRRRKGHGEPWKSERRINLYTFDTEPWYDEFKEMCKPKPKEMIQITDLYSEDVRMSLKKQLWTEYWSPGPVKG